MLRGRLHWSSEHVRRCPRSAGSARHDDGRRVFAATPAAVVDYAVGTDPTGAAVLGVLLEEDDGLINLTEYYPDTGDSGLDYAAPGYLQYNMIQQGSAGEPMILTEYRYTQRTVGPVTIYPLSAVIRYADDNRPITTSYSFPQWYGGTAQFLERVTTLPAIAMDQNGPGAAASRDEQFDAFGNRAWLLDERGFITYSQFDPVTGALVQVIQDVDGTQLPLPAGWSTPAGGGLHLVTDYTIDDQGRTTQRLGPAHDADGRAVRTATWTVYLDLAHEVRTATGWLDVATGEDTLVNPAAISIQDAEGRPLEAIQAVSNLLWPAETIPQSSYCRWAVNTYVNNRLSSTAVYYAIPASGAGDEGVNFAVTDYDYDALGRRNRVSSPGGTITRTVLDPQGNVLQVFVGTNDTGATDADPTGGGASGNNMVLVTELEYDGGQPGGNGNRTQTTQYVDDATTRVTNYTYDWRNRLLTTDGEENFFQSLTYDNLGRVTCVERYDTTASGNLVARTDTLYDDLDRVYGTIVYGVDPTSGATIGSLAGNTWYDAAGNVIKQQAAGQRTFTKTAYDGASRAIATYTGYDLDETSWADASSIADDTILEQVQTDYDEAGNAIFVTAWRRLPTADATLGSLGNATTQPLARASYQAAWYDGAGRVAATANYGTNAGQAVTRPSQAPASCDTALVSSIDYNDRGEAYQTTDPAGKIAQKAFDDAGRLITQIRNYVDGMADADHPDQDVTVATAYTPDGKVLSLTAVNPVTGDQVTRYVYGTTLAASGVARNDLLVAEIYPDSSDATGQLSYTYNRLGEVVAKTDQNGSVHAYSYDGLGRATQDGVTTVGSGVDDTVLSIGRTYNVRGQLAGVTSFADAAGVSVVNDVQLAYNAFGQLTSEYQEHAGAVDTSNTLKVQYGYADGSGGYADGSGGYVRPTQLVYPNGRVLSYGYNSGNDDAANRVSYLADLPLLPGEGWGEGIGQHLAEYQYLGASSILEVAYPQPQLRGTFDTDPNAPGTYPGLDRYGRVVDLLWQNTASGAALERIQHGYDRAGNRLWRQCPVATAAGQAFDEIYAYDGVNQLASFQRGSLNGTQTALVSGSKDFAQAWTFDATGNWVRFQEDASGYGTWDLDQPRTHNKANEITAFAASIGAVWSQPAYDRNGNMIGLPQPTDPTAAFTCLYDAWNRLVQVSEAATSQMVAQYAYDGRGFRIVKLPAPPSSGAAAEARHSYYNSDWQELEVRIGASLSAERQYVWGRRYIDDLALRDRDADGDGSLEERLYGVQDSNWNVMALANPSTVIAERCQYTVFGRVTFLDGMFANSQPVSRLDNAVLYTGRELDAETGMYLYRMRAYGDGLGRFLGRDPLGFLAGDMNLYRYANGMPVLVLDPTGLWGWSTLGSFLTGVVIGAGIVATVAIAAPLVAAAGAALLVAAGVDAASAAILATGAVSGTLLVAGGTGLVTTGVDMAANAAEGNWDAVAFDAGTLVGGVGMGVSGGGRALAEGMMGGPSPAPNTWNLADILSYEWENAGFDPSLNDPNLSEFMNRMNWLATSPTPFSGGMAATGVAGGVAAADDLIDQVLKACKP